MKPRGRTTRIDSVGIIGSGRAATALSRELRAAGVRTAMISGRSNAAGLARVVRRSDLLLFCVADEAIGPVAERLARLPGPELAGSVVLHTSGALGPEPLEPLSLRGALTGCLHPLTSFPPGGRAMRLKGGLKGVAFAVEGTPAARKAASALARRLGGRPFLVASPARPVYHMMAALVASGMSALLDAGLEVAQTRLGLSEREARRALLPLARSVLTNVSEFGTARALTGPAARGDARTVALHMKTLSGSPSGVRELYLLLSRRAVRMALADGRLGPAEATRLLRSLARNRRD